MANDGIYYSQNEGLLFNTNSTNRVRIATGGTITFSGDVYIQDTL